MRKADFCKSGMVPRGEVLCAIEVGHHFTVHAPATIARTGKVSYLSGNEKEYL